jgi:hypothetical protein
MKIGSLIEMDELGRIAAQTAKQVIFQKVREAEWEAVQKEYSTRQGRPRQWHYPRHGAAELFGGSG